MPKHIMIDNILEGCTLCYGTPVLKERLADQGTDYSLDHLGKYEVSEVASLSKYGIKTRGYIPIHRCITTVN